VRGIRPSHLEYRRRRGIGPRTLDQRVVVHLGDPVSLKVRGANRLDMVP
jgi:hypothetical protein